MNKRRLIIVIGITAACIFAAIISFVLQKQKKVDQAVKLYQEFIEGERTVGEEDITKISTPTGEPERRVETEYTMVDVTGDGIP